MGQVSPASTPREGRAGVSLARALFLGVIYLLLVPVAAAAGLWVAATYFPSQTRSLLGPALSELVSVISPEETSTEGALAKVEEMEERIAKIEADVAGIMERETIATVISVDPGQVEGIEPEGEEEQQVPMAVAHDVTERDRLLAALSAVTLARVQVVMGNREVALRETEFTVSILEGSDPLFAPEGMREMLVRAIDALRKSSPTADEWLSLVWHSLVEAVSLAEVAPPQ